MQTFDLQRVDIRVDKSPGKRDLTPENGDFQPSIDDKVSEGAKKTQRTSLDKMEAIAYGVEARFEEKTGYSGRVTETTMNVARVLGIPEAEIKRWASSRLDRLIRDTEKLREIKSRLERLQQNSVQPCDDRNISGKR